MRSDDPKVDVWAGFHYAMQPIMRDVAGKYKCLCELLTSAEVISSSNGHDFCVFLCSLTIAISVILDIRTQWSATTEPSRKLILSYKEGSVLAHWHLHTCSVECFRPHVGQGVECCRVDEYFTTFCKRRIACCYPPART